MPSYCRQGVCLAGFEVAIQCKSETASEGNERSEPGMKRRVSDIAVMILSFLVLLALSAGVALVGVEAVRGEQWQLIRLTAWLQGSGVWGGIACIAVAALALALAFMCLWRVFPHRTASQRGYVMQKMRMVPSECQFVLSRG